MVKTQMIHLSLIDHQNANSIHRIFPGDEGKFWVNFNWYWLELARRRPLIQARFIYLDSNPEPVGFMAYGQHYKDRLLKDIQAGSFELYHIVIDANHQKKGIGRLATLLSIQEIAKNESCEKVLVSCHPDNKSATQLYKGLGFVEVGRNYDDDPLYALTKEQIKSLAPHSLNLEPSLSFQKHDPWEKESRSSEKDFSWENWELGLET